MREGGLSVPFVLVLFGGALFLTCVCVRGSRRLAECFFLYCLLFFRVSLRFLFWVAIAGLIRPRVAATASLCFRH